MPTSPRVCKITLTLSSGRLSLPLSVMALMSRIFLEISVCLPFASKQLVSVSASILIFMSILTIPPVLNLKSFPMILTPRGQRLESLKK